MKLYTYFILINLYLKSRKCASFMGYFILAIKYLTVLWYIICFICVIPIHSRVTFQILVQKVIWLILCQKIKNVMLFIKLTIIINKRRQKRLN